MNYKIGKIAEMSGVSVAAIRHYVKEGLLPAPVKTSPNMAYYSETCIPLVQEIKRLQEEFFLPLPVIKKMLDLKEQGIHLNIEETAFAPVNIIRDFKGLTQIEFSKQFNIPLTKLKEYSRKGIFAPQLIDGELIYGPDDLQMGELLKEFDNTGISLESLETLISNMQHLSRQSFELITHALPRNGTEERVKKRKRLYSLTSRFINQLYLNYSREHLLRLIQKSK